ncbi:uncharacterized protein C8orf58 homolog isoform X3 [Manis pentadactyla]|uniref:uncharacterized protein C8orf58 homolog isoform X3 n=1 Tax=Manis pentadactyla TaxID=143292 RepID=UPI0018738A6E|nr:uncharacterized protein C8orf58 homolog isoform X3 [Manis pentadactyla]
MLGRRRVFAVEPLSGGGGAGQDLVRGCVAPGVTSTYRRIPDAAPGCSLDHWGGHGQLRGLGTQEQLLKLASQDSGVEMAVGDNSLATSQGLSQDSLDFEPPGAPEPLVHAAMEPSAHLGRLLTSRKLERVLEQSRQLPTSASLSHQHHSPKPPSKPVYEMPHFGSGEQEAMKAETDLETGLEEAEVARGLEPEAWANLPGQGLRYLEHLCLVLEQMASLQQLCLQLQTQRPEGNPEEEEESALVPSPPPSHAAGSEVPGLLSQMETGAKPALLPKVGVPSADPPRLSEAPEEPVHTFPSFQRHKQDLSQWNKVKVLLNRILWRSLRHPEPPALPDGPVPRTESRDLPGIPPCHPLRKTFMSSLMVKKQRTKKLPTC